MPFRKADRPVLAGRFAFQQPALLHAKMRLYADRLVLTGWHWRGFYRRCFPIRQILQIDALDDIGLVLWLASGEAVRLRVDHAAQWKTAFETHQARLRDETSD